MQLVPGQKTSKHGYSASESSTWVVSKILDEKIVPNKIGEIKFLNVLRREIKSVY